jgi:hypothetical protein
VDIYTKYQQLAVKVCCIDSKGSGCLFQPFTSEYSYVITAKHCLEGTDETPQCFVEDDIKISLYKNGSITELTVLNYYLHHENDLAVIKVQYVEGIPSTLITIPRDNQKIGLYGFPNILNDSDTTLRGHHLKSSINFIYREQHLIEFTPESHVSNIINSIGETVMGLSGSGMYFESNNNLFLIGIFTELKQEDGAFNSLSGYDLKPINDILLDNDLPLLIPEELINFERYIETAFDSNEGIIKPVLKRNAQSLMDLQPKHIVDSFNEKLYLPYNSFIEQELLNPKLWEGWASLLTYYYMDTTNLPHRENFRLIRNGNGNDHNIRMFFTEYKRLSKCIMNLFVNSYDDLEKNDLIVINTKDSNPPTKSFNSEKAQGVLRKIDSGDRDKLIERGIEIDNPEHLKNVQFIHIDLFAEKFSAYDEIRSPSKLEEMLKGSIKEVFNNVP